MSHPCSHPRATGSLLLGTGELLPSNGYRLSLTGHYENDPPVLFAPGWRLNTSPGTPSFRGLLGVAFGVSPARGMAGGKHSPAQCPGLDDDPVQRPAESVGRTKGGLRSSPTQRVSRPFTVPL